MTPELVSIIAFILLFVVGTVLPINMGALGFVAAWLVGMYALGLTEREIISGISGDLVLTSVGVTYLFAIARNNGTVDLIVRGAVRMVGGRVALIPWVMFAVTAVLTAIGAASPAACAIIGPIALGFAGRYRINPLMMGMFVVHGAQAGGFSPISIYGVITNSVMAENNLPVNELAIFLASLLFNLAIAIVLFFALGGRQLMSRRLGRDEFDDPTADEAPGSPTPTPHRPGRARSTRTRTRRPRGGGTATETRADATSARRRFADQVITLVAFAAVAFIALVFERNIGFAAITAAVILTALFPKEQKGAIKQIAWSTVLLVAGVSMLRGDPEQGRRTRGGRHVGRRAGHRPHRRAGAVLRRRHHLGVRVVDRAAADHRPDRDPADRHRATSAPSRSSPRSRWPRRSSTSARSRPTAR